MSQGNADVQVDSFERINEASGKLKFDGVDDKLMHAILENDKDRIEDGKLLGEAINQGLSALAPDMMLENMVKNYGLAEKIYGSSIIRAITGYDEGYVKRNINIPEFQRELLKKMKERVKKLEREGFLNKGSISDKGLELASLILYVEELDNLVAKGELGDKIHKRASHYGDRYDYDDYRSSNRFRDLDVRKTIKTAARRGHHEYAIEDLKVSKRRQKGQIQIIYAVDASGSMRGKKLETAKKAGIALAYKAITKKDKVGLIIFGSDVKSELRPSLNLSALVKELAGAKASKETDLALTLKRSRELFDDRKSTKHLLILTDAMPTMGKDPVEDTLKAASEIRSDGITISVVGIDLTRKGVKLAEKIATIGEGRLYIVKDLGNLDKIILEDYYAVT